MQTLLEHAKRYPHMLPQDAVKLCYQRVFGGGHMISDPNAAYQRLKDEIAQTPQENKPLLECIGGMYRLHLHAFEQSCLRTETVNSLFLYTANHPQGTKAEFEQALCDLVNCTQQGCMPFDANALSAYLSEYRAQNCPAVSHSHTYRAQYAPSYRLVPQWTKKLLPVLQSIDASLTQYGQAIVGIDGMCGGGKSTIAEFLREIYSAQLIHMDDYFLPFARKTPQRLSEPGGNVDYERFVQEVVGQPQDTPLQIRLYSCATGSLSPWQEIPPASVRIIEGSYCLHPHFARGLYDTRVYVQTDSATQQKRILARNGEEMLSRFISTWIPMENSYARAFSIAANSIVVTT